jgi:hypothetical protein
VSDNVAKRFENDIYIYSDNSVYPWFDLQLDAQNSCLFTYTTFIKLLYMFRALSAHHQEIYVTIAHMQPLVSSLSAGDCLVHRLRKM